MRDTATMLLAVDSFIYAKWLTLIASSFAFNSRYFFACVSLNWALPEMPIEICGRCVATRCEHVHVLLKQATSCRIEFICTQLYWDGEHEANPIIQWSRFTKCTIMRAQKHINDYIFQHHDYHYQLFMQIELFKFNSFSSSFQPRSGAISSGEFVDLNSSFRRISAMSFFFFPLLHQCSRTLSFQESRHDIKRYEMWHKIEKRKSQKKIAKNRKEIAKNRNKIAKKKIATITVANVYNSRIDCKIGANNVLGTGFK